ncbi:MAG: queuosine precursor transporter [Phycisphaerales bacterium]|nr:queuosine precursor transporter [Phycisphaerales bacterium]
MATQLTNQRPSQPQAALIPAAPDAFDIRFRVYLWLSGVFVTCLLVADITGSKFFHFNLFTANLPLVGSYTFVTHSVGMFAFPVTFLLTDLVNEYYGKPGARRLTYMGLGMAFLAFIMIYLARMAPTSEISPIPGQTFDAVFAMSNRLYVASLTAYFVGQMCDIWLFGVLKRLTGGRLVWLRSTGSTVVSQAIDSFLVTAILFAATNNPKTGVAYTWHEILETAATGYLLKFLIAIALTPLVYLGRWVLRTRFGMTPVPADAHA